jgi:hypothetical protein
LPSRLPSLRRACDKPLEETSPPQSFNGTLHQPQKSPTARRTSSPHFATTNGQAQHLPWPVQAKRIAGSTATRTSRATSSFSLLETPTPALERAGCTPTSNSIRAPARMVATTFPSTISPRAPSPHLPLEPAQQLHHPLRSLLYATTPHPMTIAGLLAPLARARRTVCHNVRNPILAVMLSLIHAPRIFPHIPREHAGCIPMARTMRAKRVLAVERPSSTCMKTRARSQYLYLGLWDPLLPLPPPRHQLLQGPTSTPSAPQGMQPRLLQSKIMPQWWTYLGAARLSSAWLH